VLTPLPSPPPGYYMPLFISSLPLIIPHADSGFISSQTKTETHPYSCFFLITSTTTSSPSPPPLFVLDFDYLIGRSRSCLYSPAKSYGQGSFFLSAIIFLRKCTTTKNEKKKKSPFTFSDHLSVHLFFLFLL
jgi:hypothetical protein